MLRKDTITAADIIACAVEDWCPLTQQNNAINYYQWETKILELIYYEKHVELIIPLGHSPSHIGTARRARHYNNNNRIYFTHTSN